VAAADVPNTAVLDGLGRRSPGAEVRASARLAAGLHCPAGARPAS